jgi:hypothetical protein
MIIYLRNQDLGMRRYWFLFCHEVKFHFECNFKFLHIFICEAWTSPYPNYISNIGHVWYYCIMEGLILIFQRTMLPSLAGLEMCMVRNWSGYVQRLQGRWALLPTGEGEEMDLCLSQWELWAENCLLSGLQYFFIRGKNTVVRIGNHFQFHNMLFCFPASIVQVHI